jgi:hypothetical protein
VKSKEKQIFSDEKAKKLFLENGLDPQVPYPGASKPWKSKCKKCSQIVSPTYNSIKGGTGCGVCAGKIVVPDLAEARMRRASLEPLVPYPGGRTNWKCRCMKCGKIVYPNYGDVQQGDGGCKYCGGHFVEPEDAVALMKLNNLEPLEPYKNSDTPWKCKCLKCGKTVTPRHATIQRGSGGCKFCAKRFVDAEDAVQLMRTAKFEPLEPFPGANKAWKCKCLRCRRNVQPSYSSIQSGQKGCVYCGGKKVDPQEAFDFMRSRGLEPLEEYKRADGPWKCRCMKCLKIVTPAYSAVNQGQGGCRYCTNKGLDYNASAFLYLMTHQEFGAHKIGVGNHKTRNNRINEHKKTGWLLINSKDFASGDEAFTIEQKVIIWLREIKNLGVFLSKAEMPQGGETETVDASEIDLPTIWAKVEEFSRVNGLKEQRKPNG